MTKKSGQKCKYLKKKKLLTCNKKHVKMFFNGLSVVGICLKPECGPLRAKPKQCYNF